MADDLYPYEDPVRYQRVTIGDGRNAERDLEDLLMLVVEWLRAHSDWLVRSCEVDAYAGFVTLSGLPIAQYNAEAEAAWAVELAAKAFPS